MKKKPTNPPSHEARSDKPERPSPFPPPKLGGGPAAFGKRAQPRFAPPPGIRKAGRHH